MKALYSLLVLSALLFSSCGTRDDASPRRRAYPRVNLYDTVYKPVDSFPLRFEANSAVPLRMPRAGWLDIAYPRYGATVHLTVADFPSGRLADEIDRRRERMSLNLYGMTAETRHISSADGSFESVLLVSRDPIATPLQFLAVDSCGTIVSGAAYFPGLDASSAADSIAPVVSAVERDLVHALKNLSRWN
ncbi:MAG: hypothetical protein K2G24_03315 [Muribaculaceae bacterium]|nr:hypothetical protein [Muribaculaceae bacterium]